MGWVTLSSASRQDVRVDSEPRPSSGRGALDGREVAVPTTMALARHVDDASCSDRHGVGNDTFRLRAERSETGNGRACTITYEARDACGHTTIAAATVTVPIQLWLHGRVRARFKHAHEGIDGVKGALTCRAQKLRIGPVTRSFFEFARLARLGVPRRGMQTVHGGVELRVAPLLGVVLSLGVGDIRR